MTPACICLEILTPFLTLLLWWYMQVPCFAIAYRISAWYSSLSAYYPRLMLIFGIDVSGFTFESVRQWRTPAWPRTVLLLAWAWKCPSLRLRGRQEWPRSKLQIWLKSLKYFFLYTGTLHLRAVPFVEFKNNIDSRSIQQEVENC